VTALFVACENQKAVRKPVPALRPDVHAFEEWDKVVGVGAQRTVRGSHCLCCADALVERVPEFVVHFDRQVREQKLALSIAGQVAPAVVSGPCVNIGGLF
jgi:hypothetical protein